MNKKIAYLLALGLILGSLSASYVFAEDGQNNGRGLGRGMMNRGFAIVGTVSAVNGNIFNVSGRQNESEAVATFSVDATNAQITKNNAPGTVSSILVGDTIAVQGTVNGSSIVATNIRDGAKMGFGRAMMGIVGTVSTVNGMTITVTAKAKPNQTATVYSVDASKAIVTKNGQASVVSSITVGDVILVQGTISGTNITATNIRDGGETQPEFQGNGQPVVAGFVTAVSGNIITISNNGGFTYTIDATNVKLFVKGVNNPTISSISVGDNLLVQGAINGNSVIASSVVVQKPKTASTSAGNNGLHLGFFQGIGNFFRRLFKF